MEENSKSLKENKNNILIILIAVVVSLAIGIVLGKVLFGNSDDKEKNNTPTNVINNDENNTKESLEKISGKHKFNSYCPDSGSCKKDIGIITINNQDLILSVDLDFINTESVSGYISLGDKRIYVSDLSYFYFHKSFDGFEIYQDYLLLYTSDLEPEKNANCPELEGIKGYKVYIFDSNLNEISGLAGFTLNNPYDDIKIEDNYVYYYGMLAEGDTIVYEKIDFNNILNKNFEGEVTLSKVKECK